MGAKHWSTDMKVMSKAWFKLGLCWLVSLISPAGFSLSLLIITFWPKKWSIRESPRKILRHIIWNLPERWAKVVTSDDEQYLNTSTNLFDLSKRIENEIWFQTNKMGFWKVLILKRWKEGRMALWDGPYVWTKQNFQSIISLSPKKKIHLVPSIEPNIPLKSKHFIIPTPTHTLPLSRFAINLFVFVRKDAPHVPRRGYRCASLKHPRANCWQSPKRIRPKVAVIDSREHTRVPGNGSHKNSNGVVRGAEQQTNIGAGGYLKRTFRSRDSKNSG